MNGDTENSSKTEKACELMETLEYRHYPPKAMTNNGLMNRFYEIQHELRCYVSNVISGSIPMKERNDYLAFGCVCFNEHGSDSAIYGGVLEDKNGRKLGAFLYHGRTGAVDYYNNAMLEKMRLEKSAYFDFTMVVTPPSTFNEMCKRVMNLREDSDRLYIRPLKESEKELFLNCKEFADEYYIPNEEEKQGLLTETMNKEYVPLTFFDDVKENMDNISMEYRKYRKEKELKEEEIYPNRNGLC